MDSLFAINAISRVFHVGTAICLAGGTIFILFVLLPALRGTDENTKSSLLFSTGNIWKRFVHGGTALLLITGFYNYFQQMPLHRGDGLYHALIGVKMILAFGVFFLAAVMVGNSSLAQSMKQKRQRYLGIIVLLVAIIVAISGVLKVRGVPQGALKDQQTTTTPAAG